MNPTKSKKHSEQKTFKTIHKDLETKEVIDTKNAASCVELWPMRALITAKTTPTSILTGAEVQAIAKSHFAASSGSSHAVPLRPSEQLFFLVVL
jgi:hypothetical protein